MSRGRRPLTTPSGPRTGFAFPRFGFLWLLAALFIRTLIGVVRTAMAMREGHVAALSSLALVARSAFLGLIATTWMSWVIDQMPCFRGAGGC